MLAITALLTICLAATVYLGEKQAVRCSPAAILILAAVLRLLFLFHPPQLSDDIYRYAFDGNQVLAGHTPYRDPPEAFLEQPGKTAEIAARVNHPHLVTIYPPAAQLLFATGTWLGGLTGLKLLFIGMDLWLIALLIRLASALGMPLWRVVLYAWHPLPILEIAASGHIDSAGLVALLTAVQLLLPNVLPLKRSFSSPVQHHAVPNHSRIASAFLSGGLYAVSVWTKLFPIVFLPLCYYLLRRGQFRMFILGLAVSSIFLFLPFLPEIANALATFNLYASTWEFSGLGFQTLKAWGVSGLSARLVLCFGFVLFLLYCYRFPRQRHTENAPQTTLQQILAAHYFIGFGFLLFTPTLHPWYGLYLLVFLPFFPTAPGLILSWSITLGYQVLIPYALLGQWLENRLVPHLIWAGPAAALLLGAVLKNVTVESQRQWSR